MSGNSTGSVKPQFASIVASATFTTLILLLTLVGNSLVCFSVYYFPRLRKPTNYLIVSLAVSDLLVGAFSLPFRIAQTVNGERFPESLGLAGCRFWIWVDMLCCGASIFNLVSISIEHLMAVKWPLRHRTKMTSKRAFLMILLVWISALLVASLSFVNWSGREIVFVAPQCYLLSWVYATIVTFAGFFVPLAVLLFNYACILKTAIGRARQVQKDKDANAVSFTSKRGTNKADTTGTAATPSKDISIGINRCVDPLADSHRRPTKSTRLQSMRQLKATKTIAIVLGVYIFSWFPFFVLYLTFNYCPYCFSPTHIPTQLGTAILVTFVYVLPVSNSAVNPIIYTCFNETFRSAFVQIFKKITRKSDTV